MYVLYKNLTCRYKFQKSLKFSSLNCNQAIELNKSRQILEIWIKHSQWLNLDYFKFVELRVKEVDIIVKL